MTNASTSGTYPPVESCILSVADGLLPSRYSSRPALPDSHTLAIGQVGGQSCLPPFSRFNFGTPLVTRTLQGPTAEGCQSLRFSADGSHLATTFMDWAPPNYAMEVFCWDVRTGAEQFRCGGAIVSAEADRLLLASSYRSMSYELRTYTGAAEQLPVFAGASPGSHFGPDSPYGHGLTPDGKTVWVSSHLTEPIADWITAQGLSWPFPRRNACQIRFLDASSGNVIGYLRER